MEEAKDFQCVYYVLIKGWCIDKLDVFHAKQTSMCLDPHLN